MNIPLLPRPKVDGIGRVLYRCATCGEQMEPEQAVIVSGKSYHPEHLPERTDGR
jgi:hypothetical protein